MLRKISRNLVFSRNFTIPEAKDKVNYILLRGAKFPKRGHIYQESFLVQERKLFQFKACYELTSIACLFSFIIQHNSNQLLYLSHVKDSYTFASSIKTQKSNCSQLTAGEGLCDGNLKDQSNHGINDLKKPVHFYCLFH